MNEPHSSDQEDFQQELEALRLILRKNLRKLKKNQDPMLGKQLDILDGKRPVPGNGIGDLE